MRSPQRQEVLQAARWWADKLRGPSAQGGKDTPEDVKVQEVMARVCGDQRINVFEQALADLMEQAAGHHHFGVTVQVRDVPDWKLSEACRRAGIDASLLPTRTVMRIVSGSVTVQSGDGAKVEIFAL